MKTEQENKERKQQPNGLIYKILLAVCVIGFFSFGGMYVRNQMLEKQAQELYEELLAQQAANEVQEEPVVEAEPEPEELPEPVDPLEELGIIVPEKELDWEALAEENADIYAWIHIPNTNVDYPILQHPTDDNYYLDRNLDGSKGYPGCIYTQSLNDKDFTDPHTVLYGHNMKDGSMFANLHKFEDNLFFEENPYIFVYTPDKTYAYEIFAAYEFSDAHLLYAYDFSDPESFEEYIQDVKNVRTMTSHIKDQWVGAEDKIITLSTCIGNKPNKRYLVSAVLVNGEDEHGTIQ